MASWPVPYRLADDVGRVAAPRQMMSMWRLGALVLIVLLVFGALWLVNRARVARASSRPRKDLQLPLEELEMRLMAGLRAQGYHIDYTAGPLMSVRRSGEVTLVSYRDWSRPRATRRRMQQLRVAMKERGAAGGKLLSCYEKPAGLEAVLAASSIEWIGKEALEELLQERGAEPAELITSFIPERAEDTPQQPNQPVASKPLVPPRCPRCDAEMTLETASQGTASGQQFWRCSRRGSCKGMRPA